jgi:predicted transcriptional regulator
MTSQSPNLNLTDSLLDVLSALLDGPATARALAVRLQRPIAAVRYNLDQLLAKDLVVADGCEQIGGITEQLYRLPAGELTINLEGGLSVALKRVQRGIEAADLLGLPATASLVAVRVSPEIVGKLLNALAQLRDEAEGYNLQEGQGRRFNLFLAGWSGE